MSLKIPEAIQKVKSLPFTPFSVPSPECFSFLLHSSLDVVCGYRHMCDASLFQSCSFPFVTLGNDSPSVKPEDLLGNHDDTRAR